MPLWADRADHDSDGNDISQTYVKVEDLPNTEGGVPEVTSNDDGKVLTASYSGGTASYSWQPAQGGTTYTAGNMISISSNTVGVSTTSGITDIQIVNARPADPVATVLYLIPAT